MLRLQDGTKPEEGQEKESHLRIKIRGGIGTGVIRAGFGIERKSRVLIGYARHNFAKAVCGVLPRPNIERYTK